MLVALGPSDLHHEGSTLGRQDWRQPAGRPATRRTYKHRDDATLYRRRQQSPASARRPHLTLRLGQTRATLRTFIAQFFVPAPLAGRTGDAACPQVGPGE